MARASRPVRGGTGFVVLIIFIVLCLALIGGYVWLVPHWAKRGSSLTQIQKDIRDSLEGPLSQTDPTLNAHSAASADDAAYGNDFFTKVAQYAAKGMKYDALVAKSGYDGATAVATELQTAVQPEPETLRAYVAKLKQDFEDLGRLYRQANTDMALAVTDRSRVQDLLDKESARLKEALDQNIKELAAAKQEADKTLALYQQKMNQAVDDAKKAWGEERAAEDRFKKMVADKDAQLAKVKDDLTFAREELERKKPKEVAIKEAHILQADPVDGFAIIDLGKRDGIQNGEKFTVVRVGKGGARIAKAELQVVRVDNLVCQAEVTKADKNDPIMRNDIVQRDKKTE